MAASMAANQKDGCYNQPQQQDTHLFHSDSSEFTAINSHHNPDMKEEVDTLAAQSSVFGRLCEVVNTHLIKGFTPVYFVSVMGTGISSAVLYNFPYPAHWLRICSHIMFAFACLLFLISSVFFVISVVKHPKKLYVFHFDPAVAPFMGAIAMGYNTLVNYIYFLTGKSWVIGTFTLWWIAVFLSLYTACVVFYLALVGKNKHTPKIETHNLHATILMPVVTLTVAASSGNLFAPDLPTHNLQILTMLTCYIMWSVAISLSFVIIAVYFWKLFVHKIPGTAVVFTSFLPVGVMGQGAFGVLLFGVNMHKYFSDNASKLTPENLPYLGTSNAVDETTLSAIIGNVILYSCTLMSLFLTSFGYFCSFIAVVSCLSKISPFAKNPNQQFVYTSDKFFKRRLTGAVRFSKAFWAMTFPLGTMALSNTELHKVFPGLKAFRVVGAMYGASLLVITIGCLVGVLYTVALEAGYILMGEREDNEVAKETV